MYIFEFKLASLKKRCRLLLIIFFNSESYIYGEANLKCNIYYSFVEKARDRKLISRMSCQYF